MTDNREEIVKKLAKKVLALGGMYRSKPTFDHRLTPDECEVCQKSLHKATTLIKKALSQSYRQGVEEERDRIRNIVEWMKPSQIIRNAQRIGEPLIKKSDLLAKLEET